MEENINKEEKKIDIGLLLVMLLILLVLALIFLLVGQNTNLIYKKVKDDNIVISVPFNFMVIDSNDYRETSEKPIINYYYIHKDFAFNQDQMMDMIFKDLYPGEYSEIYSAEIDGYNALQRHYIYKTLINYDTYYMAGLGTLIELEDRFLVIDMYNTLVRGEGEVLDFEDIQLELYNKITNMIKVDDNTADMPAAENITIQFYDLEFNLPEYWFGLMFSGNKDISIYNTEMSASIRSYLITDHNRARIDYIFQHVGNRDDSVFYNYIGNYKMGEEEFELYYSKHDYELVATSEKYIIQFTISPYSNEYSSTQEIKRAMIDMLFGNQK
ncbi:MAG: hypothetical protein AB1Z23_12435 [Eubacteriales bacterium]